MSFTISVIICTYNPRMDYLERTLQGLAAQTLAPDLWELLIVDNNSSEPLQNRIDLSQFPKARIVCEKKQGLTPARIRGFEESKGGLLLYVDDDNVLNSDYLERGAALAKEFSFLGAIGGSTIGVYEQAPSRHAEKYMNYIGVRTIEAIRWSNSTSDGEHCPIGAGMFVKRSVVDAWAQRTKNDPLRLSMDRSGDLLTGSGDTDMAYTAIDLGLGVGVFPELELQHLISVDRVDHAYLFRLAEGTSYSANMLKCIRGEKMWRAPKKYAIRRMLRYCLNWARPSRRFDCQFRRAQASGIRRAVEDAKSLKVKAETNVS
jgi:glycosyltransferase involved in cell wall biosynthesis